MKNTPRDVLDSLVVQWLRAVPMALDFITLSNVFALAVHMHACWLVALLITGANTLISKPLLKPGTTLLTIWIEKIGLKDAPQHIDPFLNVYVKSKLKAECECSESVIPVSLSQSSIKCIWHVVNQHPCQPAQSRLA